MLPEAESLLYDALVAGQSAMQFAQGMTYEQYLADKMRRAAIERMLFIVGEAAAQLRVKDRATFDLLTGANKIVGLRNLLAHGYNSVDDLQLWTILQNNLPSTVAELAHLLGVAL